MGSTVASGSDAEETIQYSNRDAIQKMADHEPNSVGLNNRPSSLRVPEAFQDGEHKKKNLKVTIDSIPQIRVFERVEMSTLQPSASPTEQGIVGPVLNIPNSQYEVSEPMEVVTLPRAGVH